MKKSTKALLMAALCMVIVGAAFCIVGACFGFTFSQFIEAAEEGRLEIQLPFDMGIKQEPSVKRVTEPLPTSVYEGAEAEYQETFRGIDSLDLDLRVAQCTIFLWNEEEFLVKGADLPDDFDCRKEGRELEIDCDEDEWRFWEKRTGAVLEIYVPREQLLEKVVIAAGVGEIEVQDGYLICEELQLESGVGACRIRADVQEKIEIDGGIGSVELELKGRETDFNFDLDNGVGEVLIGDAHLKDLGADEQIDNDADKEVIIDNGIGNITIRFSE